MKQTFFSYEVPLPLGKRGRCPNTQPLCTVLLVSPAMPVQWGPRNCPPGPCSCSCITWLQKDPGIESLWDGERGGGDAGCSLYHAEALGHLPGDGPQHLMSGKTPWALTACFKCREYLQLLQGLVANKYYGLVFARAMGT